jgi:hypothetical protein
MENTTKTEKANEENDFVWRFFLFPFEDEFEECKFGWLFK